MSERKTLHTPDGVTHLAIRRNDGELSTLCDMMAAIEAIVTYTDVPNTPIYDVTSNDVVTCVRCLADMVK